MGHHQRDLAGWASFEERAKATNAIAYWPMAEGQGTTIIDALSRGQAGTYTGVQWTNEAPLFGQMRPKWDGVNDNGNVYSAALSAAMSFSEGALLIFMKVFDSGVWNDASSRYIASFYRDANNRMYVEKRATANTLRLLHVSNSQTTLSDITISDTRFFSLMMSWSVKNNRFRAFINGVQQGAAQTGILAESGSGLSTSFNQLGAFSSGNVHYGYLGNGLLWAKDADAAMIDLGKVA